MAPSRDVNVKVYMVLSSKLAIPNCLRPTISETTPCPVCVIVIVRSGVVLDASYAGVVLPWTSWIRGGSIVQ
eukprot:3941169-Rhodomonas_salina.1